MALPINLLQKPNPAHHKGHFGHVGVLAGDADTIGASILSALGALRAGAGLVSLLGEGVRPPETPIEVMFKKPSKTDFKKITSIVIGPGLGTTSTMRQLAQETFSKALETKIPVVLDAEGLFLLNTKQTSGTIIATPHPGEATKLVGSSPSIEMLLALPINNTHSIVWVLKTANPIVCAKGLTPKIIPGETPALAIAGVLGVAAHQKAGRLLAKKAIRGHLATELANMIPTVLFGKNRS
jgi:NAD(P)H-hydrate epimerase